MRLFSSSSVSSSFLTVAVLVAGTMLWTSCAPDASPLVRTPTVRGYLAVAVGQSEQAERSGLYSREIEPKDIFLPGVTVYLEDPQTGDRSEETVTDLSGRFTLYPPGSSTYQLCWSSEVYGDGCTPANLAAGGTPQFLSTVYVELPRKEGFVAMIGEVTTADGDPARMFDPLLNINAFATVGLDDASGARLADVYVNNFGDYLLPYVPIREKFELATRIESEEFVQEVLPEAEIEVEPLHRVNLELENHRPRLDPLVAFDAGTGRRVQNAPPGSTLALTAQAREPDGDSVEYAWFVDDGQGQLSSTADPAVEWTLPTAPGRYSVTVVAYDGRGGYDKEVLSVLADGNGIPFTGIVVEPDGTPVDAAEVEIVGNPVVTTGTDGRFQTRVNEAERYVVNVRKKGYALNSQIYDRSVTGGRWILRRAQVVVVDPTKRTRIVHERSERDCPGPNSRRAGLGPAAESLLEPQWQDGRGNAIDPPEKYGDQERKRRSNVIVARDLDLPPCGPGVSVVLPANSVLDANGDPAVAPFEVAISSVDLLSPQQMPGDDSVIPEAGGGGNIESFGAGALDFPPGFRLKPGTNAEVVIPVDRSRLMGGSLPPTVPFLTYDETQGLWIEEGTMTLQVVDGVQSYVGSTDHFSPFNADNVRTDEAACVRVFSPTLPGNYDLEVVAPLGGTGAPKVLTKPMSNVAPFEHVIYNLPNNTNITLAPMTQGADPQLLGFYVVNSGPPQNPNNAPNIPPGPPYDSCQNFVVLKVGSAPDSPFGGEFLHGLGYINAANLGFDDLTSAAPTGNALRDAIVDASRNYYSAVDPNNLRTTFDDFKSHHGFNADPNNPVPGEIVAQYANSGDLGFGRDMHCLKKNNGDVACYVTNYGDGYKSVPPGGGTDDHDDANAAGQRATVGQSAEVATVAMEYSAIEGDPAADKVVKFFVYKNNFPNPGEYGRSISANLDGRGERPVPQLCMVCHGGQIPQQSPQGVPAFGTADQVKLDARFLPFDYSLFTFPSNPPNLTKADQDASIKALNEQIVNAAPPAPIGDPIREVVSGLYNNGSSQSQLVFSPPGWVNGASADAPNQSDFYQQVLTPACRNCHIAQPFSQLQFNTSEKLINLANNVAQVPANNQLMLGTVQARVCGDYLMPHALRTHDIFWDVYWDVPEWGAPPAPPMSAHLQNFGDGIGGSTWQAGLCTSFISNLASQPSNFYQQSIQSIFNGKCVACHVTDGAAGFLELTVGNSYNNLIPGRVVPGNDDPSAPGNTLLARVTEPVPAQRMPPDCFRAPEPPNGNLPCLSQADVDKIKAWIRSGAN